MLNLEKKNLEIILWYFMPEETRTRLSVFLWEPLVTQVPCHGQHLAANLGQHFLGAKRRIVWSPQRKYNH